MQEDQPLYGVSRTKLHGATTFSVFDMSNRFGVLLIHEVDQHYFIFTTPSQGS